MTVGKCLCLPKFLVLFSFQTKLTSQDSSLNLPQGPDMLSLSPICFSNSRAGLRLLQDSRRLCSPAISPATPCAWRGREYCVIHLCIPSICLEELCLTSTREQHTCETSKGEISCLVKVKIYSMALSQRELLSFLTGKRVS